MKKEELVVLDTDDAAAEKKTVTGWVSRTGIFYGQNEDMARYAGCTHKKCSCGNIMTKGWTKCDVCRAIKTRERYDALPFEEWDGKKPLCTYDGDQYFFNESDIDDYCEEHEIESKDLMLVICSPNFPRQISSEYWADALPEEGDIPKELQAKLDELNIFIGTLGPLSYSPSGIRTEYVTV